MGRAGRCQWVGLENRSLVLRAFPERAGSDRLDGAFWPKSGEAGTPEQPVVLLEVQMHAKVGFKHRLGAQSFRFLQLHPEVLHLAVVVVVVAPAPQAWSSPVAQPTADVR
jgi:hypothetical protein